VEDAPYWPGNICGNHVDRDIGELGLRSVVARRFFGGAVNPASIVR
jgi:hypothetical protein